MALRIGGVPVLLTPSEVIGSARAVLGWTDEMVEIVAKLPQRVDRMLDDVEALIATIERLIDRVDRVAANAESVTANADRIVGHAATVTGAAETVVVRTTVIAGQAESVLTDAVGTLASATGMLDVYRPIADTAAPMARRFVEEFSLDELHAAIRLVDSLPRLTSHVEEDVLPLLGTLDRVGPDMHELLSVVKDVRSAVSSIPGLSLLRRRADTAAPRG